MKTGLQRILLGLGITALSVKTAFAGVFVVKRIQVEGNKRMSSAAVISYLPIYTGQKFDTSKSGALIAALYKSGYFSDVQLFQRGDTLVVKVSETETISRITITGNKKIDDKRLKPVMKNLGLQEGDPYRPEKVRELRLGLLEAYKNIGRYDVAIDVETTKGAYNTVQIHIAVKEGVTTKVHSIKFSGNHVFSSHVLREQFSLTTPGLFTFFSHADVYSSLEFQKSLMNLQSFYFDHGYLDFRIVSKHVTVSKNRRHADIAIEVFEGPQYRISGYKLVGNFADNPQILKLVREVHPGEIFSRKKIVDIDERIGDYLADQGYAFPKIAAKPELNHTNNTVFLRWEVNSGRRMYVRYINVAGNSRTTEKALRYQMRQLEGSAYSQKNVNESKRRIANLPYFKDIQVEPIPVEGTSNQVDLNYHVTEVTAGRASLQGGYSTIDGFVYGANISDPNFMGTGKYASIGFQNSAYQQQYSIAYTDPFYTPYGMSRGFNIFYNHTTPRDVNLDTYTMDSYGISVNYSMPISEYNYLSYGFGYSHIAVGNANPTMISPAGFVFLGNHPSPYNDFTVNLGVAHSNLDRAIFPMSGDFESLGVEGGVPVVGSSLAYYKLNFVGRWYLRLGRLSGFVVHPHLSLGYGNGYGSYNSLPFFFNYFGGGIDTLPGYEPNTLGPKNPNDISNSVGGNVEVFGGLNLIVPNGISDNVRTSLFVDFGNIFQTHRTAGNPGNPTAPSTIYENVSIDNLRMSAGLLVSWNSPFGLMTVGYGIPFNVKPGDHIGQFGFTFGASL